MASLGEPLGRVATLETSLRSTADLRDPIMRLVAIGPGLDRAAALGGPLTRVAEMRTSLEAVASLRGSLDQVSRLEPRLAAVAELGAPLQQVSALRAPLEQVGALTGPLSAVASIANHPILLLLIAVAGLLAWGLVTFLAVRLAILSTQPR